MIQIDDETFINPFYVKVLYLDAHDSQHNPYRVAVRLQDDSMYYLDWCQTRQEALEKIKMWEHKFSFYIQKFCF